MLLHWCLCSFVPLFPVKFPFKFFLQLIESHLHSQFWKVINASLHASKIASFFYCFLWSLMSEVGLNLFWRKIFRHQPPKAVCFRRYALHGRPRADLSISFCFKGDNDSLLFGIGLHFLSLSSPVLHSPLPFHLPTPPPSVGRPLLVTPSTVPMLYRSVTEQARDERQIKTTLFPLSPSHRARLNLRFFIFFLIFLPSLPPLASTQNYLEPSCLTTWWRTIVYACGAR